MHSLFRVTLPNDLCDARHVFEKCWYKLLKQNKVKVSTLRVSITCPPPKSSLYIETENFPCASATTFMLQLKHIFCCSSLVDID